MCVFLKKSIIEYEELIATIVRLFKSLKDRRTNANYPRSEIVMVSEPKAREGSAYYSRSAMRQSRLARSDTFVIAPRAHPGKYIGVEYLAVFKRRTKAFSFLDKTSLNRVIHACNEPQTVCQRTNERRTTTERTIFSQIIGEKKKKKENSGERITKNTARNELMSFST